VRGGIRCCRGDDALEGICLSAERGVGAKQPASRRH
jgi:hypothetical protein